MVVLQTNKNVIGDANGASKRSDKRNKYDERVEKKKVYPNRSICKLTSKSTTRMLLHFSSLENDRNIAPLLFPSIYIYINIHKQTQQYTSKNGNVHHHHFSWKHENESENGMWDMETGRMKNETKRNEIKMNGCHRNLKRQTLKICIVSNLTFFVTLLALISEKQRKTRSFSLAYTETLGYDTIKEKSPDWLRWRWKDLTNRNIFVAFILVVVVVFRNFIRKKDSFLLLSNMFVAGGGKREWKNAANSGARHSNDYIIWHIVKMFYFDQ